MQYCPIAVSQKLNLSHFYATEQLLLYLYIFKA